MQVLAPGLRFAPLGLVDMYNAGGAIEGLTYHGQSCTEVLEIDSGLANKLNEVSLQSLDGGVVATICMEVKGCGRFGAYSSAKPKSCILNSADVEFSYDPSSGLLSLELENMPEGEQKLHQVVVEL